jgi:hypothetical protein
VKIRPIFFTHTLSNLARGIVAKAGMRNFNQTNRAAGILGMCRDESFCSSEFADTPPSTGRGWAQWSGAKAT